MRILANGSANPEPVEQDRALAGGATTVAGRVTNRAVADALGVEMTAPADVLQ